MELSKRGQYRDHLRRGKALLAQLVDRRRDELETLSYVDAHKRLALLCRLARAEGDGADAEGERAAEARLHAAIDQRRRGSVLLVKRSGGAGEALGEGEGEPAQRGKRRNHATEVLGGFRTELRAAGAEGGEDDQS